MGGNGRGNKYLFAFYIPKFRELRLVDLLKLVFLRFGVSLLFLIFAFLV